MKASAAERSFEPALRRAQTPWPEPNAEPERTRSSPARVDESNQGAETTRNVGATTRVDPSTRARRRLQLPSLGTSLAIALIALNLACALAPQLIATALPQTMQSDAILLAPNRSHWFGTDQFGRDVFSLVVYGARQSLLIGASAVLVSCSAGVSIGILAGYAGGFIDALLMRLVDVWMAVPGILLAIALSTALGPSLITTILAVSVAAVPRYARVLRAQALALRGRTFIAAARAAGASHRSILRGHILPHCAAPILVMAALGVGSSILVGAGLSFLGLGVNDERPDWGYLLTQGRGYLTVAWWIVTFPGLAISALVIAVNRSADALRRRIDPRSEQV
jgi:peptide/nickel transport system permease protein